MTDATSLILPFFVILAVGLVLSEFFRRLHLPWSIALIIGGIIIGPTGLGIFHPNTTFSFLGEVGLVFLVFIAGLETKLSTLRKIGKGIAILAFLNSVIPFFVGWLIATSFGYPLIPALLLGAIFTSSSVAVIVPSLEATRFMHTRLGKSVLAAAIIEDIVSFVLLSILLQSNQQLTPLPLPAFYFLLFAALLFLRLLIPKVERLLAREIKEQRDLFEQELRLVFVMIVGIVLLFQSLGLHAVIAGFFAGLVLSDTIKSDLLREKLHTLSYGLFIPIFFVLLGTQVNIHVFTAIPGAALAAAAIIGASLAAKFSTGFVGGLLNRFTVRQSAFVGSATLPQLSTAVAVASLSIPLRLDERLTASIIALSVVTALVGPLLMRLLARHTSKREILERGLLG
jgi:Kef-type K+ transport system membrane component KefB